MSSSTEKIKELKIINWILLGVIGLLIVGAAGWYIAKNQDEINKQLLDSLKTPTTENSSTDTGTVDIDAELTSLDKEMDSSSDIDLEQTDLTEAGVGI